MLPADVKIRLRSNVAPGVPMVLPAVDGLKLRFRPATSLSVPPVAMSALVTGPTSVMSMFPLASNVRKRAVNGRAAMEKSPSVKNVMSFNVPVPVRFVPVLDV